MHAQGLRVTTQVLTTTTMLLLLLLLQLMQQRIEVPVTCSTQRSKGWVCGLWGGG